MIELTSKEFALLEYLMRNAGRRVTRAMIIEHVWNLSFDSATNLVDVYVAYAGRLGADEVQIVRCGSYAWVRLVVADTSPPTCFSMLTGQARGGVTSLAGRIWRRWDDRRRSWMATDRCAPVHDGKADCGGTRPLNR